MVFLKLILLFLPDTDIRSVFITVCTINETVFTTICILSVYFVAVHTFIWHTKYTPTIHKPIGKIIMTTVFSLCLFLYLSFFFFETLFT